MATVTQQINSSDTGATNIAKIDQKIEVTIFPVADVDRAKEFYLKIGWRLDADFNFPSFRVVPGHAAWLDVLAAIRHEPDFSRARFGQGIHHRVRSRSRPQCAGCHGCPGW